MHPDLARLVRLQEAETRAARAQQRIADAPGAIAALDVRLSASRDAVAAARQAATANQAARRTLDNDLRAAEQRLAKYKDQLMEVKTNTEYHAMQHQIAAAAAEVGRVEELILVNMLQADELGAQLKAAEARLRTDEDTVARERAALEADVEQMHRVLAESACERTALAGEISPPYLAIFERVFKVRQGIAVATAVDGHCSICHVRLRPQVYNTILRNEEVVQCDHCQRVLYFAGRQQSARSEPALDAARARQGEHDRPSP
jgi:hypothetical protein